MKLVSEPPQKTGGEGRNTQRIAKAGIACNLVLVVIGSLFGRRLQRALPELIPFLPVVAFMAIVLGSVYALKLGRGGRRQLPPPRDLTKIALLSLLLPLLMIWSCEHLIVAPIERIHFCKFAALACFSFFAQRGANTTRFIRAFLFAAAIGCIEETAQLYIPDRVFDPRDMLLNISAAFFGSVYSAMVMLWKPFLRLQEDEEKARILPATDG